MKRNLKSKIQNSGLKKKTNPPIAFLWDESFLWGLMANRTFRGLSLPFDLVRAEEVRAGALREYKMLFVPGGWASNKNKALGDTGMQAIRDFVHSGGNYLGFCGGAGLATLDGIGLLNIRRRPTRERVPSFSGRIHLHINEHPIWKGLNRGQSPVFHAWWPSQFVVEDENIRILATYGDALPDSFSSDLNTHDIEATGDWKEIEKVYGINLDPKRLLNEPAVAEGRFGKGKVILSLIHFDTPDDMNGQQVLKNLWKYLAGKQGSGEAGKRGSEEARNYRSAEDKTSELLALCSDLISLGERNFLWFWRNSMLLQWRRGVRGLEYCTLYVLIKEIAETVRKRKSVKMRKRGSREACKLSFDDSLDNIRNLLVPFVEKAERLLVLERQTMQRGYITYERCDDSEIKALRAELFSEAKSHGGMFKRLIDEIDELLFLLIK